MIASLRILLVEDSEADAKLIVHQLQRHSFRVETLRVDDGPKLRDALTSGDWDVVLADWSLPRFSGPAALDLVAEMTPEILVIIVSGTIGEELAVAAMQRGATDFLLKDRLGRLLPAIERAVAARRDRAEKAHAQAVLDATRERLHRAVVAGNVGLWTWELATNTAYFSDEWKRQIGYEPHEIGTEMHEWAARVHPDDLPGANAAVEAYLGGASPRYEVEFRFRHKNGRYRTILAQASATRGPDGAPVRLLGSHVDVTTRAELQAQLMHSQKLESVGQLAGGIAHDFNNLITVIDATATLAADGLRQDDPLYEDLVEIQRAGQCAAALTRQLLAFSRRQILSPTTLRMPPCSTG